MKAFFHFVVIGCTLLLTVERATADDDQKCTVTKINDRVVSIEVQKVTHPKAAWTLEDCKTDSGRVAQKQGSGPYGKSGSYTATFGKPNALQTFTGKIDSK